MRQDNPQAVLFRLLFLLIIVLPLFTSCKETKIFPAYEWRVYERLDSAYNTCYVSAHKKDVNIRKEDGKYQLSSMDGSSEYYLLIQ